VYPIKTPIRKRPPLVEIPGRQGPDNKLGRFYIKNYGYNLTNMKDSVSRDVRSNRVFCIDCVYYKSLKCPGWEACPFRIEALKSIQEELQRRGNNEQS